MACQVNPDGTITCTDADARNIAPLLGASSWPAKVDAKAQADKVRDLLLGPNACEMFVVLLDADSVRQGTGSSPR